MIFLSNNLRVQLSDRTTRAWIRSKGAPVSSQQESNKQVENRWKLQWILFITSSIHYGCNNLTYCDYATYIVTMQRRMQVLTEGKGIKSK